jgi:hypothetical protein
MGWQDFFWIHSFIWNWDERNDVELICPSTSKKFVKKNMKSWILWEKISPSQSKTEKKKCKKNPRPLVVVLLKKQ